MDQRQEVLVPAHRDAVFRHAAESFEDTIVEWPVDLAPVADGTRRLGPTRPLLGKRLDLQPIDGDDAKAFVQQIVRQGVARGPETDDEHVAAVVWQRIWTPSIQRVPTRQQSVNLHTPWHGKHVREHARLDLRDVDGILLLINAGLHAVVADAMPRAGTHRVVDGDDGQGADRIAPLSQQVHLGDLLVERAAGQWTAERVGDDGACLVANAFRARVLVAFVTEHAVMDFAQHFTHREAFVGQFEAVAAPKLLFGSNHQFRHRGIGPHDTHEAHGIDGFRKAEEDPVPEAAIVDMRRTPSLERLDFGGDARFFVRGIVRARSFFPVEQRAAVARKGEFRIGPGRQPLDARVILRRRLDVHTCLEQRQRSTTNEVDFEAEQIVVDARRRRQFVGVRTYAEQTRQKPAHMRRERDDQVGSSNRTERRRIGAMRFPLSPEVGIGSPRLAAEQLVENCEPRGLMQIGKREAGDSERVMRQGNTSHIQGTSPIDTLSAHGSIRVRGSQTTVQRSGLEFAPLPAHSSERLTAIQDQRWNAMFIRTFFVVAITGTAALSAACSGSSRQLSPSGPSPLGVSSSTVAAPGGSNAAMAPGRSNHVAGDGTVANLAGTCPNLTLVVRGVHVTTDSSTTYEHGECGNLCQGTKVVVDGDVQSDGTVLAASIEIVDQPGGQPVEGDGDVGAGKGTCPTLTMVVSGYPVMTLSTTDFTGVGTCEDIRPGSRIHVQGTIAGG